MFNQALTLSAALLLWTPSVGAQQSRQHATGAGQEAGMMARCMMHSGGMGQDTMDIMRGGMGMMSSFAPGPAMLIRMSPVLDLTEKQTTELEDIQADLTDDRASHMPLVMEAHQQAAKWIASGETDLTAYEDTLREAMDHLIAVHVKVARAALDARALLTDEQRARLDGATAMMRHMKSMMDGGMHRMSDLPDQDSETTGHGRGRSSGG